MERREGACSRFVSLIYKSKAKRGKGEKEREVLVQVRGSAVNKVN